VLIFNPMFNSSSSKIDVNAGVSSNCPYKSMDGEEEQKTDPAADESTYDKSLRKSYKESTSNLPINIA
jgi:hypothetical protein